VPGNGTESPASGRSTRVSPIGPPSRHLSGKWAERASRLRRARANMRSRSAASSARIPSVTDTRWFNIG